MPGKLLSALLLPQQLKMHLSKYKVLIGQLHESRESVDSRHLVMLVAGKSTVERPQIFWLGAYSGHNGKVVQILNF